MRKHLFKYLMIAMTIAASAAMVPACSPKFGKLPGGERLERIKASPNYVDGEFRNLEPAEPSPEGGGRLAAIWRHLFKESGGRMPSTALPMRKTDLNSLERQRDCIVWLGHSSCYLHLGGRRILIDPVFAGNAAPFSFLNQAFKGDYPYSAENMPDIDLLIISHDHWDHLEYQTMIALQPRVKAVVCPLGVGAHLERWGFAPSVIHEGDWNEAFELEPGITVHILPARHFSGRWLQRNKALWASFMLETPGRRVFYSGDSGYGKHFADIGRKFVELDLAIIENGQYNASWKKMHMTPEETAQAAEDLRAGAVLPVHSGRFSMAHHPWDEPYTRIAAASEGKGFRLLTPIIGEVLYLDGRERNFGRWWESVNAQSPHRD